MGACSEINTATLPDHGSRRDRITEAGRAQIDHAAYMSGHGGYTGTIAEANGVRDTGLHFDTLEEAREYANRAFDSEPHMVRKDGRWVEETADNPVPKNHIPEKWEAALAVTYGGSKDAPERVLFYGVYSS